MKNVIITSIALVGFIFGANAQTVVSQKNEAKGPQAKNQKAYERDLSSATILALSSIDVQGPQAKNLEVGAIAEAGQQGLVIVDQSENLQGPQAKNVKHFRNSSSAGSEAQEESLLAQLN